MHSSKWHLAKLQCQAKLSATSLFFSSKFIRLCPAKLVINQKSLLASTRVSMEASLSLLLHVLKENSQNKYNIRLEWPSFWHWCDFYIFCWSLSHPFPLHILNYFLLAFQTGKEGFHIRCKIGMSRLGETLYDEPFCEIPWPGSKWGSGEFIDVWNRSSPVISSETCDGTRLARKSPWGGDLSLALSRLFIDSLFAFYRHQCIFFPCFWRWIFLQDNMSTQTRDREVETAYSIQ